MPQDCGDENPAGDSDAFFFFNLKFTNIIYNFNDWKPNTKIAKELSLK